VTTRCQTATERGSALRRLGRTRPNAGEMELLRAASLELEPAAAAWRRWIAGHLIDTAHHRSTDLLPAVSANLNAEVLGREADRLRGLRRRVWADNQYALAALVDAANVLAAHGLDPVVVKGAALATTVFSEPGTRAMADIDLLVGADRFEQARDALVAIGWRRQDPVDGPFFHAVALVDDRGRGVDLHKWVAFPRFSPVPEQTWLDRAVPHTINGIELRRLTSSDELVLAVLHGLLTNSASASRWPLDVVRLAASAGEVEGFWDLVVASATEIQAGPVVGDALAMCRAELGVEVPVEVLELLAAAPLDRGLARHWALCRRGISLEWRVRRYVRLERSEGHAPSFLGYAAPRVRSLRSRGVKPVIVGRIDRAKHIIADRTRGRRGR
jgi:hypothetical protein